MDYYLLFHYKKTMKYTTLKEHREFFSKNGFIEFEAIFSGSEIDLWQASINVGLSSRLNTTSDKLFEYLPNQIFGAGYDLWRSNFALKKLVSNRAVTEIAADLFEEKKIRLGFSFLLPSQGETPSLINVKNPYNKFLEKPRTLLQFSSLKEVLGGFILCVEGFCNENEEHSLFFPKSPGNGVFVKPGFSIPFPEMFRRKNQLFFFVGYVYPKTLYVHNEEDPHGHFLKTLGYVYGDQLLDKKHPLLIR